MRKPDGGVRCAAAAAALALSLAPLAAAPGDYELLSDAVSSIAAKGLGAGSESAVLGDALDALRSSFTEPERALGLSLLPPGGDVSKPQFVRALRDLARQTDRPERYWIERSLRYLRDRDAHSDFLDAEEFRVYKGGKDREFAGVGMEVERGDDGGFICMPFPGMAAEKAGIKWGAELLSVDGRAVRGRSLAAVAGDIRGRVGSPVTISVSKRGLFRRHADFTINRERIEAPAVLLKQSVAGSVIQVLTFNGDTTRSVRDILGTHKAGRTLTLDLRGCPGGSLQAAIATADLFLARGKRVASVERSKGTGHFEALREPDDDESPLVVLQDSRSASAAEVLIAALTANGRAISVGGRTRGKGTVQEVISLREGYGMVLTTGRLLDPDGESWHLRGLEPGHR